MKVLLGQSCLTFHEPMGCTSVRGILQARILGWITILFSGNLPDPGIESASPELYVDSLSTKPPGKSKLCVHRSKVHRELCVFLMRKQWL